MWKHLYYLLELNRADYVLLSHFNCEITKIIPNMNGL